MQSTFTDSTGFFGFGYYAVALENITAGTGGAISVGTYLTTINTDAGGDAYTLADGVHPGQLKRIKLLVDGGGDGVITPTNLSGGTTLTFANAGEACLLQWNGSSWVLIDPQDGTGVTAVAIA